MSVVALSPKQERRLVDFLDVKFLDVTRAYKKRSHPSTALPTLSAYLDATHQLLNMILQIPPVDPSSSLRIALLLRLTGDVITSIPGYPPLLETIPELLDWLEDLDHGWCAVLRSQSWDSEARTGVPVSSNTRQSTATSSTERARLRSLLIAGTEMLEDWLEGLDSDDDGRLAVGTQFDEIFSETLTEMGLLHGETNINPVPTPTCTSTGTGLED